MSAAHNQINSKHCAHIFAVQRYLFMATFQLLLMKEKLHVPLHAALRAIAGSHPYIQACAAVLVEPKAIHKPDSQWEHSFSPYFILLLVKLSGMVCLFDAHRLCFIVLLKH